MEFRVAEYNDYERIATLHTQSWKQFYQGILSADFLEHDALEDRLAIWQTRLINPPFNQHVILLEEGGLLCGFICAFGNHDFERGTLIDNLHIDQAYRGRGLGNQLIAEMAKWIEHYFPNNGVCLEVMKDNHQAVGFYDRLGGERSDERLWNAPSGEKVPEYIYTWKSAQSLAQATEAKKLVTG
jgi:ribosomal protein S18 acetylase RimI-like enzyme